jgi:hypothetical protein
MASVVRICWPEPRASPWRAWRAQEQLLIDRGGQYKRAIQLFTKKPSATGDIGPGFQNTLPAASLYRPDDR